ncbi:hypothetical protein FRC12_011567 [Ceratobasidium sp. 428]|nr:hypothetical protein FRC12_011567 [Ceratobasidium sp. 428]
MMVSRAKSWDTGDSVSSVTVSPDSARVGVGCGRVVQLWDRHDGKMVLSSLRGHSDNVLSVVYSPDGRTIASGSSDNTLRVWDTVTGAQGVQPIDGHEGAVSAVVFSSDGRLIISGSWDGGIRLWDSRTGRPARKPINMPIGVGSVAVSPDGSKVVGGGYFGVMYTYDAATGAMLFPHEGHRGWVGSIAFSPDGRRIVSASNDQTVRIWDVSTGSYVGGPLEGHTASVQSVAFSPDGRYIASGSWDKTVRIWDAATGEQADSFYHHTDRVNAVTFTPNDYTLISGSKDNTIKQWNALRTETQGGTNDNTPPLNIHLGQTPEVSSLPPSATVRSLGTEPLLFDEITSTTTPEQIVLHLSVRGCANLTDQLDLTTCSAYPISSGGFGDIYRCKLEDNRDVAVKTIRLYVDSSEQTQKHLKHAARELYTWSKCRHPNVQPLLGLVMFRDQIGMVAAWESNGDMPRYLQRYPNTDRCRMSLQIVAGLSYMHELGVVHGDLKGANVLIAEDGSPRLADFGNAALQELSLRFTHSSTKASLSPRWAAPELFEGAKCTVPADMYALGMTILLLQEALTGDVPFSDKPDHYAVMYSVMVERSQPNRPKTSIPIGSTNGDKMWSLLQSCWEYEPEKRPSALEVKKIVMEITQAGLK